MDEARKAQDLEFEQREAKRKQATKMYLDEAQQEPAYDLALDSMEKDIQENVNAAYDEKADWVWAKEALLVTHGLTMTVEEGTAWRREIRKETRKAHPLLSYEELKPYVKRAILRATYEWHKKDLQRIKDSFLAAKKKEDDLLVRGPSQNALLEEFSSSLTAKQTEDILAEVRRGNPDAKGKEFGAAYRAFKLQAALVWYRGRLNEGKDSSPPLTGTDRPIEPLSLEAQPKDSGLESSSSSEDGLEVIRKDLSRQKQVTSSSSPSENKIATKGKTYNLTSRGEQCPSAK